MNSNCCNTPIKIFTHDEGTSFHLCTACNEACDDTPTPFDWRSELSLAKAKIKSSYVRSGLLEHHQETSGELMAFKVGWICAVDECFKLMIDKLQKVEAATEERVRREIENEIDSSMCEVGIGGSDWRFKKVYALAVKTTKKYMLDVIGDHEAEKDWPEDDDYDEFRKHGRNELRIKQRQKLELLGEKGGA